MLYEPEMLAGTTGNEALEAYIANELRKVAEAFLGIEEILLVELNAEPNKPRDGMIVLADGTNWNPGSGAGFYGRNGGTWVFLG